MCPSTRCDTGPQDSFDPGGPTGRSTSYYNALPCSTSFRGDNAEPKCDECGATLIVPRGYMSWAVCPECGLVASDLQQEELSPSIPSAPSSHYVDRGIGGRRPLGVRRRYCSQDKTILPRVLEGIRANPEELPAFVVSTACLEARRILKRRGNSCLKREDVLNAALERALALHHLPPLNARRAKAVNRLMPPRGVGTYMERLEKYIDGLVSSEPRIHIEALRVANNGVREKLSYSGYSPLSAAMAIIYKVAYPKYTQKELEQMARKRFNAGSAESMTRLLQVLFRF